jgi:hypothetical protein
MVEAHDSLFCETRSRRALALSYRPLLGWPLAALALLLLVLGLLKLIDV